MENTNNLESGFQIKNLILLESSLHRVNDVIFDENMRNDFNINVEVGVKENIITVIEEAILTQKNQDIEQVKIKVRMVGIFECVGKTLLDNFEEFGKINGAAIIFPYIREHIANLSLKSCIAPIILPPINFTKMKKN